MCTYTREPFDPIDDNKEVIVIDRWEIGIH